ncbi:hypothetical protein OKW21_003483 [Catalinimonas alkaloidigena]|uniref:type II toxin-antitoxin system PemK/MazF family toxin n=1 Tax=Catalinimonas alkaloidigena TaxID=1075417 RepID=UPI002405A2CB|nr:type II toxin-antitoxin system PemK/MazF family toxin [Catalinimonas alkaloidigena]MDF9798220.1 hypothetical protein [Catalinimonas alkaloidigena]
MINRTLETLEKLPEDRIHEIADFADYVLKKHEEQLLQSGIETLVSESDSFTFLHDDEDLYDENDQKKSTDGERGHRSHSNSFTDLSGRKKRPALISIAGSLDVTVSFISTQLHWQEPTDFLLQPDPTNGLKKASLVRTSKIATNDKSLVIGKLGNITSNQIEDLDKKLTQLFNLDIK